MNCPNCDKDDWFWSSKIGIFKHVGILSTRAIMHVSVRRSYWYLAIALLLVVTAIWGFMLATGALQDNRSEQIADGQQVADGHQAMLEHLEVMRERSINDDPIFGSNRLRAAQKKLDQLPIDAPLDRQINELAFVGDLELLSGETVNAAEHLANAYELLEGIREQVPDQIERKALLDVAIAHLRLGEVQNCVECNTCDSCILPIREDGVHKFPRGSRKAIDYLTTLLEMEPEHLTARWLLNIAAMTVGDYPDQVQPKYLIPFEAFASGSEFPRFVNGAKAAGVNTLSLSGGVVADDFNGDGWIDLMTSDWSDDGQLRCFINRGNMQFDEVTEAAGLSGLYGGLNLVQADYDNDGDVDVLVLRGAWRGEAGRVPNSLLQNDGQGRFVDVTIAVGLAHEHFPTQTAAWADFDNDGDLDLFIGNEDFPCQLFRNDGGQFVDIAPQAGVTNDRFTKAVSWGDFDGDRYPDLYVSNYGSPTSLAKVSTAGSSRQPETGLFDAPQGMPNRLYRNNRDGTFTDVAEELGVTRPLLSFPAWFWDFNNDGHLDIFAASYSAKTHDVAAQYLGIAHNAQPDCLYLNDGRGGFREVATELGIDRVAATMGANFGDLDNDGLDDIYLGTGAPEYESLVPNVMYHNVAGTRFENVTAAGGFGHLQKGHAIAFADFDNDGDQDLFCVLGGAYPGDAFANALFVNPGPRASFAPTTANSSIANDRANHWLKLSLKGTTSNRCGIGARIKVVVREEMPAVQSTSDSSVTHSAIDGLTGRERNIYKWVNSGGSFGANPLRKEIGLGKASSITKLEVFWPTSNQTQTFEDVPLDQTIQITEGIDQYVVQQPAMTQN